MKVAFFFCLSLGENKSLRATPLNERAKLNLGRRQTLEQITPQ